MDVKVTIGGIEATITVANAAEAVALLQSLSVDKQTAAAPCATTSQPAPSLAKTPPSPRHGEHSPNVSEKVSEASLQAVLLRLQGSSAAKIIKAVAESPNGLVDSQVRVKCPFIKDANLGPLMSHISKACRRESVPMDALLEVKKRRVSSKVMQYYYKVPPQAAAMIRSIPDFDKQPEFPDVNPLDGFEMQDL